MAEQVLIRPKIALVFWVEYLALSEHICTGRVYCCGLDCLQSALCFRASVVLSFSWDGTQGHTCIFHTLRNRKFYLWKVVEEFKKR